MICIQKMVVHFSDFKFLYFYLCLVECNSISTQKFSTPAHFSCIWAEARFFYYYFLKDWIGMFLKRWWLRLVHVAGRISESVPVRRTRNCETRIRSWRTTKPRPAICTVLWGCCFIFNSTRILVYILHQL